MKIAIFGASGQGRETADICYTLGYTEIVFLVASDKEKCAWDNKLIVENIKNVRDLDSSGYVFSIGIGDPKTRQNVFNRYPTLSFPTIIHPSATFGRDQEKTLLNSKGNIVSAGTRFTNNIAVGDFNIFNLNSSISHDCTIGNFVSIMCGAVVSGNVAIADKAYIGAGATIKQGGNENKLLIGQSSIVGAGAVVVKNVRGDITVVGIPAKTLYNN